MNLFFTILMFSFSVFGAEIATIQTLPKQREILFSMTDDTLYKSLETQFQTQPCRIRNTFILNNIRENYMNFNCRAELIKFLMNSGYKPIDAKTFVK